MKSAYFAIAILLTAASAAAQFTITDVMNAGSRIPSKAAGGGIPQGAIFVATGKGIGADFQQATFPLPTTDGLAGITIQVSSSGAVASCPMVYVSPNEVAAIMPSATPTGLATVTVTNNGVSASKDIAVIPSSFGIFTTSGTNGQGNAVAFNVNADGSTTPNSIQTAVMPGQDILINGTGLGAIPSDETQSGATDVPATDFKVFVGAIQATVVSAGRGTCCDGLDPNFKIPEGVAGWDVIRVTIPPGVIGCYMPVVVQMGRLIGNIATIAVDQGGATCTIAASIISDELAAQLANKTGISFAVLGLSHGNVTSKSPKGVVSKTISDTGSADFLRYTNMPGSVAASDFERPNNVCVVGNYPTPNGGATRDGQPVPIVPLTSVGLDAGPTITVTGPGGTRSINKQTVGKIFDYKTAVFGNPGNYFAPGTYTMSDGTGGPDVGKFTTSIDVPVAPFVWTNEPSVDAVIDRSQDMPITWTGGTPGTQVIIQGESSTTAGGTFLCAAPVDDGQFSIPAWVLLTLAPANGRVLITNTVRKTFPAPGIDVGTISFNSTTETSLTWQ